MIVQGLIKITAIVEAGETGNAKLYITTFCSECYF